MSSGHRPVSHARWNSRRASATFACARATTVRTAADPDGLRIAVTHTLLGLDRASPRSARTINDYVQADAGDGFVLVPHITPGGLDEFADDETAEECAASWRRCGRGDVSLPRR
ncbi:hypothetical protein [Streptomyces sp. T028]|uniref:hypothetical protein n=1 Tax=Streptomyces sp. T028 TaxID=3394379 RepID=UPI003A8B4227